MIKGVNKTIIEVNDTGNKYFEKAILFVRPEIVGKGIDNIECKAKDYVAGVGEMKSNYFLIKNDYKRKRKKRINVLFGYLSAIIVGTILFFILK